MNTRTTRIIGLMLAPWIASTSLLAEPIGRPTPPPCSAEGACVPHRGTWGYTRTIWRPWPGTQTESTDTGQTGAVGSDLVTPTVTPDPRSEDKLAPPKVDALEPVDDLPPSDDEGINIPDREEFDAGRGRGDGEARPERPEAPPAGRPPFLDRGPFERIDRGNPPAPGQPPAGQPPAGPNNNPPILPFGQVPTGPAFPSAMQQPQQPVRPAISQVDLPPQLPESMRQPTGNIQQAQPAVVITASAMDESSDASLIPTDFESQPKFIQQSYQAVPTPPRGDAPPSLPAGLFGDR